MLWPENFNEELLTFFPNAISSFHIRALNGVILYVLALSCYFAMFRDYIFIAVATTGFAELASNLMRTKRKAHG